MRLSRAFAVATAAVAMTGCSADGMMMEESRGPEFQSVSELTSLPEFIPGLGALQVDPATLPAGPFLAYDRGGDLVSTIYMVPLAEMNDQKSFDDLGAPGRRVVSTDLYYNAGHPGVSVPHYHFVLWHVDKSTAELD